MTVTPGVPRSQFSTPLVDCATTSSLRDFTLGMSTRIGPSIATPYAAPLRAAHAARALAISVLVGMQPLLTQVPPKCLRSTIATLRPAPARRTASAGPAWPVPMTIASDDSGIGVSGDGCRHDQGALTLDVMEAMTPVALSNASLSMPSMWCLRAM